MATAASAAARSACGAAAASVQQGRVGVRRRSFYISASSSSSSSSSLIRSPSLRLRVCDGAGAGAASLAPTTTAAGGRPECEEDEEALPPENDLLARDGRRRQKIVCRAARRDVKGGNDATELASAEHRRAIFTRLGSSLGSRDNAWEGRSIIFGRTVMGCHYQSWRWEGCTMAKGGRSRSERKGFRRAALPDDAPFALAIGASILSTLVLPVHAAEQDETKEESLLGTSDVLSGAMQIISFIPLFNWLVWVFAWLDSRQPRYLAFSAVYLAPYLKSGLSLSPDDSWLPIASILACVVHVQLDISVNIERQPLLGDASPEKTQVNGAEFGADGLMRRFKGVSDGSDSRDMEQAIGQDEKGGAEWEAVQEEARRKEFAEWDEKLSKSEVLEEAKEADI